MTLYILDNDFLSAQVIPVQKSVDDDFQAPIVSAFNYVPLKKSGKGKSPKSPRTKKRKGRGKKNTTYSLEAPEEKQGLCV
ncbi:hypothetical protein CU098_005474 [Rhizopus stolonifer]|uniref:Uncharacterized protein n=1 Tax=Rhizopus stolonifer TaxID=4846 RepID=A0A367K4M4_RHIST|nr:hypothetical protein CU098_005474 [Rhizopus stolonifer]